MHIFRATAVALLAITCLLNSGCARIGCNTLGSMMVASPKKVDPSIEYTNVQMALRPTPLVDRRHWVSVGPDNARMLVSIVEPRPRGTCPRGTVILVHGAYGRSESLMGSAVRLSRSQYRAVLVDLRGHGQSSDAKLTYGVQESHDLSVVVDTLEAQGLIEGPLGVYGFSYGASTAVQFAARDSRVDAVVAVAPFASLRRAAAYLAKTRIPWGRNLMTPERVEEALQVAAAEAQFNIDEADTRKAIQRTSAPVLLVHGTADRVIEPENSFDLHLSSGGASELLLIPGATHNDLNNDENGTVANLATEWFGRHLHAES